MANDELGVITTVPGIVGRARDQALACSRRAREHELAYRRWKFWSSLLGVLTAIGATVAASTLLLADTGGARAVVAGLVALAAAAFATINASFLQGRVEENRVARAAFTNLRSRYSLLADLPPKEIPAARAQFDDIERAHIQAEIEAPPPEAWARQRRASEEDGAAERPDGHAIVEPPAPTPPAADRAASTAAPPRAAAPVPRTVARPNAASGR